MADRKRALVIGFGNPGRLDDGLGPALAERIEALALPGVTVDANYHLTVEDAEAIARCDVVIFADAHTSVTEPFSLTPVTPAEHVSFSTHSLSPEAAVALARELFDATAEAYVLAIRGYEFNEFGQALSPAARENLDKAAAALASMLTRGVFTATEPGHAPSADCDKDLTCKTENT